MADFVQTEKKANEYDQTPNHTAHVKKRLPHWGLLKLT